MTEHYKSHPSGIEAIEITQYESFLRGNVIKYIMRAPYKGDELADLEKAAEYLQWEIERVKEENFLARERFKDLMSRKFVFVDADENEWDSDENIVYVADNWQATYKKRAAEVNDHYDYYRAGMYSGHGSVIGINPATSTMYNNASFDEVAFPDKCQECEGDCKVC